MPVLSEVERLLDETLNAVRAHPKHEMGFERRRAIYETLLLIDTKRGQLTHGWAAVLAAQRVLPYWENAEMLAEEWRLDPRNWLRLAEHVLAGTADIKAAGKESGNIHYQCGNMIDMMDQDGLLQDQRIGCALQAAHLALSEVTGANPFRSLHSFQNVNTQKGAATPVDTSDEPMAVRGFAGDCPSFSRLCRFDRLHIARSRTSDKSYFDCDR